MISETAALWAKARRYEDILRRDPAAYSFAPLADIYRSLGLIEDAVDTARKGVDLHPDFAAGQMSLARAALESSLKGEAKSALEVVVRVTPENLEAQRLLADLYSAEGDEVGAMRCLAVVSALDLDLREALTSEQPAADELFEEIQEADILELTDDLIEDDSAGIGAPFAAMPERPSLGEFQSRPEPFMIDEAPPLPSQQQEEPLAEEPLSFASSQNEEPLGEEPESSVSLQTEEPSAGEPAPLAAPVSSATIAELYISQGFTEKGADIYRELLRAEPGNQAYVRRLAEIETPAAATTEPAFDLNETVLTANSTQEETQTAPSSPLDALNGWLGNIGRVKECRTKNL